MITACVVAFVLTQGLVLVGCKRWGDLMKEFDKATGSVG